jgi:hypothetical protein
VVYHFILATFLPFISGCCVSAPIRYILPLLALHVTFSIGCLLLKIHICHVHAPLLWCLVFLFCSQDGFKQFRPSFFRRKKTFILLYYSYLFSYSQQTNNELCSFGLQMHACAISSFIYTFSVFKCLFSTGTSSSKMSPIYRYKPASALSQSRTFHIITSGGTSGARNATKKPTDDSTPFICSKCGCKRLRNRYHFACLNSYAHRAE